MTLLHCEDGAMLRQAGQKLIAEGRGAVANFPDARPVAAEVAAVDQAIGIARRTGAPVYIVHLSSAAALDRCRRARAAGLPVYVEARPLYLHLTRERFAEPEAAKYAGAPPLREASDRDALWAGLAAGDVDTLCSDHAPWTLDAKLDPALNAVTARQGVADLETLMPMLYSEGVLAGRISLDQFVALTSANAARIFGLYPRKGAIAVGSDADIALWDPRYRRTIDGARMQSLSGYSVYDGWQVQGWPKFVIRRGQLVLADGQITARPGDGEWLRRTTTARALPSRPMRPLPPGFTKAQRWETVLTAPDCHSARRAVAVLGEAGPRGGDVRTPLPRSLLPLAGGTSPAVPSDLSGTKPSFSSGRPREWRPDTAFVRCDGARLSRKLRIQALASQRSKPNERLPSLSGTADGASQDLRRDPPD